MSVQATPTAGGATFDDVATVNDMYGLIEKIGKQIFSEAKTSNRLGIFDKGFLEYGTTVEESIVQAAESRVYDPTASSATVCIPPELVTRYFNEWVDRDYKVSVRAKDVRAVLNGGRTVGDLAAASLASIDAGERRDDYNDMKALLAKFALAEASGGYAKDGQRITLAEGATLTDLLETVRFVSDDMSFDNAKYSGVVKNTGTEADPVWTPYLQTETPIDKLVVIMPHNLLNSIDVRVFASMYNLGKADIVPTIIPIDTDDGLVYVTDVDAFGILTRDREFGEVENRNARSRDYVLGVSKMFYYNPLYKTAVIDASVLLPSESDGEGEGGEGGEG